MKRDVVVFALAVLVCTWATLACARLALAQAAPITAQPAPTFAVNLTAQDSANINQICTYAMDNASLGLPTRTAVGQFCLGLLNTLGEAQKKSSEGTSSAKPEEKK